MSALEETGKPELLKRVNRLQGCCAVPELRVSSDGLPNVRFNCCRDRLCPRCQRQRGMAVRERILAVVQTFNAPRFATLTLAHREESLSVMNVRMANAFRELRKRPEWKALVSGGVWVIETTLNAKTGNWHLHLHLIIDGKFFPQKLLSKLWLTVTGDSSICDIRAVPDRKKAVAYVADYVAKPVELATWEPEKIREFATAMHGVRMVHTFGKAHRAVVESAEPPSEEKASVFVIHTLTLRRLAASGNAKAQFAVNTLRVWRKNVCEAMGLTWFRTETGLGQLQQEEVKTALRVCSELERGILIDPPPRHEPTREELESTLLFGRPQY